MVLFIRLMTYNYVFASTLDEKDIKDGEIVNFKQHSTNSWDSQKYSEKTAVENQNIGGTYCKIYVPHLKDFFENPCSSEDDSIKSKEITFIESNVEFTNDLKIILQQFESCQSAHDVILLLRNAIAFCEKNPSNVENCKGFY